MGAYAKDSLTRDEATLLVNKLNNILNSAKVRHEVAGSFRRNKQVDIGDIDVLIVDHPLKNVRELINSSFNLTNKGRIGDKISSFAVSFGGKEVQIELNLTTRFSIGASLLHSTGNNYFNIALRTVAKKKGLKLNQYGLFLDNQNLASKSEIEIFNKLGYSDISGSERNVKTINDAFSLLRNKEI